MQFNKLQKNTVKSSLKQRAAILRKVATIQAKKDEILALYDAEISTHLEIVNSLDNTILKAANHQGTVDEIITFLEEEKVSNANVNILETTEPVTNIENVIVDIPVQEEQPYTAETVLEESAEISQTKEIPEISSEAEEVLNF